MKKLFFTSMIVIMAFGQSIFAKVNITENLSSVSVEHNGKTIKIQRIQNTRNKLTNSYTKTSRPCPPFCIHPMEVAEGVKTVGELEVLDFLQNEAKNNGGLLIDSRMPQWYKKSTIPGALNIPFTLLTKGNKKGYFDRILTLLGAVKQDGIWNFSKAQKLLLFCNGPWCDQSPREIKSLLAVGYPASKILYYRGGMQNWQMMGLTIIKP
jgi:rhodanese-related sulfurtransferase